ncbi:metallophosphoesterase [Synechococcus elongatus]|uniref:metallophosphoesterase n=1 Tax=Synechococcus elongatus TaxID=32046 RepID=UPI000F7E9951|nr:metallophosphoesterase [Synechococcus elongatus]
MVEDFAGDAMTLSIAQITDLHLLVDPQAALRGCVTTPRAAAVFANLKQRSPDLLLLSGDLSEDGSPASYERLRDWVEELGCPAIAIAGNHDQPERLTEICGRSPFMGEPVYSIQGWRIIALDSYQPKRIDGRLRGNQLDWLDQRLGEDSSPTLLMLHHPPVLIGVTKMDAIGLKDGPEFLEVIAHHQQVRLVLSGHAHQAFIQGRGLTTFLGCPATAMQFDQPELPAGWRSLELEPDGSWRSQIHWVDTDSSHFD